MYNSLNFNYLLSDNDINNSLRPPDDIKSGELFMLLEAQYRNFYTLRNEDSALDHDITCLRSFFRREAVINKKIEKIGKLEVRAALAEMDNYYKKGSGMLNSTLSALRKYYRFLMDTFNKNLDLNILAVQLPKRKFTTPKILMYNEISEVLKHEYPKTKTFMERRDLMCILLYATTGARRSELLHVTLEDIDLKNKMIHFNITKGKKPRTVFLPDITIEYIKLYLKERQEKLKVNTNAFLINKNGRPGTVSMLKIISKKFKEKYNLELKLHQFRSGYITDLVKNGVDVNIASKIIGHESVSTTLKHYLVLQSKQFKSSAQKHPAYEEIVENKIEEPIKPAIVKFVDIKNAFINK